MEDDGGDDPAAHAGQQVLVLGRAERRDEARDPPPNGIAATARAPWPTAPVAAHFQPAKISSAAAEALVLDSEVRTAFSAAVILREVS